MQISYIPIFKDNYIWILYNINLKKCVVIDPGDAKSIILYIKTNNFKIESILLTHYHNDHILGVDELYNKFNIPIYGPFKIKKKYPINFIKEGDYINILNKKIKVLNLSGHTSNHIGFYIYPWIFCGDSMFSAGCGKIFNGGNIIQMYKSFQKINNLPSETFIFSSHEYTISNIKFFLKIFPKDKFVKKLLLNIKKKIKIKKNSLPSNLFLERRINIFLLCNKFKLKKILNFSLKNNNYPYIFSCLRKLKNKFS
ncbi:hydroxyacylglutathione hydrolase [Sodalis-like secondary symbiont of Drepanosiphum platanoidis]|uniref:hydroxyacylglutathione hydrolase n=1 Tax=Sodalis-like secondary symbiont of Drepanosiphum platanoidis TaxID=2994493 RepID=UPI0034649DB5